MGFKAQTSISNDSINDETVVQGMGGDFVAGFTQMVDSERDPRNLLIVFKMVSIVAASVPLGHFLFYIECTY